MFTDENLALMKEVKFKHDSLETAITILEKEIREETGIKVKK